MSYLATGLHVGIPDVDYHADTLTPEPALSSSGIRTLLTETPAHFAARNPRLTLWPEHLDESTKEQDFGSVAHALILGVGAAFEVIDVSQFRNKDGTPAKTFANSQAKAAKEEAERAGRIVITPEVYRDALQVQKSAEARLKERFGGWPIGESEVTGIWQRTAAGRRIWCRSRMDHFSRRAATILDLKSTSKAISDDELRKAIAANGGDLQEAWYIEGVETIHPELAGLVQFIRVFVEVEPPFATRFIKISESWRVRARYRIDRAADLFATCLANNDFPGYPMAEATLSAPGWLEAKWTEEELGEAV